MKVKVIIIFSSFLMSIHFDSWSAGAVTSGSGECTPQKIIEGCVTVSVPGGLNCNCSTTRGLARKEDPPKPSPAVACPSSCVFGCEPGTSTCKPSLDPTPAPEPEPEPAPTPVPVKSTSPSSWKVVDSWVVPTCIYSKMPKVLEVCEGEYFCVGDIVCVIDGIAEKLHGVYCPAHTKRKCPSSADKCADTLEWTFNDGRKPQNFRSIMGRNKKSGDMLFGKENDSSQGGETFFGGSTAGQGGATVFGGSTAGQSGETFFGGSTGDPTTDAGATDAGATDAGAQQ